MPLTVNEDEARRIIAGGFGDGEISDDVWRLIKDHRMVIRFMQGKEQPGVVIAAVSEHLEGFRSLFGDNLPKKRKPDVIAGNPTVKQIVERKLQKGSPSVAVAAHALLSYAGLIQNFRIHLYRELKAPGTPYGDSPEGLRLIAESIGGMTKEDAAAALAVWSDKERETPDLSTDATNSFNRAKEARENATDPLHGLSVEMFEPGGLYERGPYEGLLCLGTPEEPVYAAVRIYQQEGVLMLLKKTAQRLAYSYRWTESQALGFILCDFTPSLTQLQVNYERHHLIPGLSRIVLTVDPATSPEEVREAYKAKRMEVYGARDRTLSPHRVQLFTICFRGLGSTYDSWPEKMKIWNDYAATWNAITKDDQTSAPFPQYEDVHRFKHEAKKALEAILDPTNALNGAVGEFAIGAIDASTYRDLAKKYADS